MSTLRTFNLQNPDSGTVNIEMDQGGNTLMTGIATVRGAAHFTSTSGSDAVGIGTDITAYKLDVRVTGAEAGLRVYNPDTSSNASGIIRLGNDDNQNSAFLKLNGANNSSTVGGAANLVLGTGTAREVHLATNGTSRLSITSAGYVGINKTPSTYQFEVSGGSANTVASFESSDAISRILFKDNSGEAMVGAVGDALTFYTSTNATERLRITSAGLVGIGTDTPGAILEVFDATSNTILNVKSGDSGAVLNLIDDSARSSIEQNGTTLKISSDTGAEDASSDIRLQVDGSTKMLVNSSGNVGINETNPIGDLSITGANGSTMEFQPDIVSGTNRITNFNRSTSTYKAFRLDASQHEFLISGSEKVRITSAGNFGIGVDPATGDGGNSNYNNWDIPKLHVRGPSNSGKFYLLGRFHAGSDADSTGAQIVIHHDNDRGMALQGGRSSGNRSYGAIKSLDNLSRESNVMVFTGGNGQGVENIKFYTNGGSTGTNERMSINTHGTVHTGGSTEISQSSLTPDLITQAGVISPLFWRPFGGLTSGPSTSGPGYLDLGTGGVRHNLTDPHLGAGLGGSQFQGGLINDYGQTFSNTASGTTREAISWNRFRILFRGVCPGSGYSVSTVKFRYSTYHYSNGWQDHAGTEWTYTGTEQVRGGRWVVGPWINPSSYFTNWADVPGFALYYNDNSSGLNFRIAGGVYYQYAYFQ